MPVTKIKKDLPQKKDKKKDLKKDLEQLKERLMVTSWHHMQTESSVKQIFFELIDILKKDI
ncbi:MAG: hypothetical protein NTY22_09780 [Proteobacteria bacterium]|nr:hypothetical protein [Pseudomonadota bacterium]